MINNRTESGAWYKEVRRKRHAGRAQPMRAHQCSCPAGPHCCACATSACAATQAASFVAPPTSPANHQAAHLRNNDPRQFSQAVHELQAPAAAQPAHEERRGASGGAQRGQGKSQQVELQVTGEGERVEAQSAGSVGARQACATSWRAGWNEADMCSGRCRS